jgi:methionine-rich copper-binding protein CopC
MHSRSVIAALALLGLTALATTDAQAQCSFDQSAPNAGDVLADPQPTMTLQFLFEIDLQKVRLLDEKFAEWPIDWVRSTNEVRTAEFRATRALPPGKYLISWEGYVTVHSHPDGGSVNFTVASADAPASPASPASPAAAPQAGAAPRSAQGSPYRAFLGAREPQPGL